MSDVNWKDEKRLALLKQLCEEGLTCSQIAKRFGDCTRSAIIGIVHRKGYKLGHVSCSAQQTKAQREAHRELMRLRKRARPKRQPPHSLGPVIVIDIPPPIGPIGTFPPDPPEDPRACRFIADDPILAKDENGSPTWRCCGHPVVPGLPWCHGHHAHLAGQVTLDRAKYAKWRKQRGLDAA